MPEIKTSEQKMIMVQMEADPQGCSDYVSKVGSALLSGEGADILAADVLPKNILKADSLKTLVAKYLECQS